MQAPFKPGEKRAVADPKAMAMKKTSPAKMKDLSGDGKVTKKDVLIGRGVIKANSPAKMKDVSKKTAYNIKEASNQKLTASARKHYAENAQAAMKNKKKK
jgi:hypothetical protein